MHCQEKTHLEEITQDILSNHGIVSCGFTLDTWYQHRNPGGSYSERCVSEVYVNFSNGRNLKILCMICSRITVIIHENSLIIMCCNNTGTRLNISDLLHYVNQVPLETQALCSVIYETYELDNNGNLIEDVFHWQDEQESEESDEVSEVAEVDEVAELVEDVISDDHAIDDILNPFKVISYLISNNIQGRITDCEENLFYSKNKEYCESESCKRLELDDPYSNLFGYANDGLCKRLN